MAADVSFTIEAIDKSTKAISGIRGSILSLNQAVQLAGAVYRGVNQIIEATIGEYVKYADQVRGLSQLTNQSAEETSRLIQVTEDYKISVTDLTTASRKLATEGLSLNVGTIAELSDQYLKLNTGAERQAFLTKNLGRASAEWTDILMQGSDMILARNAAVSDMLILDQRGVDEARRYEFALDDFNDSVMGVKIALGNELLPILMFVMDYISGESIPGWLAFGDTVDNVMRISITKSWDFGQQIKSAMGDYATPAMQGLIDKFFGVPGAASVASAAAEGASKKFYLLGESALEAAKKVGYLNGMLNGTNFQQGKPAIRATASGDIGGSGTITLASWASEADKAYARAHPDIYAPVKASGGFVSGRYAITGDSLSGRRTGYEELVDFQQKRVYSAPQTQAMGAVKGYAAGSGGIDLSPQTIRDLASALKYELAPFL